MLKKSEKKSRKKALPKVKLTANLIWPIVTINKEYFYVSILVQFITKKCVFFGKRRAKLIKGDRKPVDVHIQARGYDGNGAEMKCQASGKTPLSKRFPPLLHALTN